MRIYEDTNPQDEAHKFIVPNNIPPLSEIDDMQACPECGTDGYLSDIGLVINNKSIIEDEFPIVNELLKWCDQGKKESDQLNLKDKRKMFVHFKKRIYKELEKL